MAQSINALIEDNATKVVWISSPMRETQERTQVLRQHQLGLQVQAEVIKVVANQHQHPPQQQGSTGNGQTVSEADGKDGDSLDFPGGQNPNTGPPNPGQIGANQIQQGPTGTAIARMF